MKNKQNGFLKSIILIVIALFLLSYFFHISPKTVFDWVVNVIRSVF